MATWPGWAPRCTPTGVRCRPSAPITNRRWPWPPSPTPRPMRAGGSWPARPRSDRGRRTWSRRRRWRMSTACRCCCYPAICSPTGAPIRCSSRSRISAIPRSRPTMRSGRWRGTGTGSCGPSRFWSPPPPPCACCSIRPNAARRCCACRRTCKPKPSTARPSSSPSVSTRSAVRLRMRANWRARSRRSRPRANR